MTSSDSLVEGPATEPLQEVTLQRLLSLLLHQPWNAADFSVQLWLRLNQQPQKRQAPFLALAPSAQQKDSSKAPQPMTWLPFGAPLRHARGDTFFDKGSRPMREKGERR